MNCCSVSLIILWTDKNNRNWKKKLEKGKLLTISMYVNKCTEHCNGQWKLIRYGQTDRESNSQQIHFNKTVHNIVITPRQRLFRVNHRKLTSPQDGRETV